MGWYGDEWMLSMTERCGVNALAVRKTRLQLQDQGQQLCSYKPSKFLRLYLKRAESRFLWSVRIGFQKSLLFFVDCEIQNVSYDRMIILELTLAEEVVKAVMPNSEILHRVFQY